MHTVQAAALYFLVVFGTGFVLGSVRVLLVAPRVGERAAELLEMPLMFLAIVLTARLVVHRFAGRAVFWPVVGLIAATAVLACDAVVGVWLRGLSVRAVFLDRDPVSGAAYYSLLAVFALAPLLVARLRRQAESSGRS
jgi:hypothetical protein